MQHAKMRPAMFYKKLESNKALSTNAISSVISNNNMTITITGVRACTADESPYPIIIENNSKYTTIARIRVVE